MVVRLSGQRCSSTAALIGEAATLARTHGEMLAHLPATVHASILVELQKWPTLFQPEQRYQRALLEHLSRVPKSSAGQRDGGDRADRGTRPESPRSRDRHPAGFQDAAQALLRQRGLQVAWRSEVDGFFRTIDPRSRPGSIPPMHRGVSSFRSMGAASRSSATNCGAASKAPASACRWTWTRRRAPNSSSGTCLARRMAHGAPALLNAATAVVSARRVARSNRTRRFTPCCDAGRSTQARAAAPTGMSYDRLRQYRDDLTRALNTQDPERGREPAGVCRLRAQPPDRPACRRAALRRPTSCIAFVRDVLLTGNGTLLDEQHVRRMGRGAGAQARRSRASSITRFGVRDKLRPFSGMVMFSQPRPSDQLPSVQDPAGSFVDVEQLSYYVWLNAEKTRPTRQRRSICFSPKASTRCWRSDRIGRPRPQSGLRPGAAVRMYAPRWRIGLGVPSAGHAGQSIEAIISGTSELRASIEAECVQVPLHGLAGKRVHVGRWTRCGIRGVDHPGSGHSGDLRTRMRSRWPAFSAAAGRSEPAPRTSARTPS